MADEHNLTLVLNSHDPKDISHFTWPHLPFSIFHFHFARNRLRIHSPLGQKASIQTARSPHNIIWHNLFDLQGQSLYTPFGKSTFLSKNQFVSLMTPDVTGLYTVEATRLTSMLEKESGDFAD